MSSRPMQVRWLLAAAATWLGLAASPLGCGAGADAAGSGVGSATVTQNVVGGGSTASSDAGSADDARADAALPEPAFNPCPATGACAILPLGDSITAGTGSTHGAGYRLELFRLAQEHARALTYVGRSSSGPTQVASVPFPRAHEGHSGYLIDTGPERPGLLPIMDPVFAAVAPNIVLLMIGTNDIPWKLDLPNEPKRLGVLIDKITSLAPNALVVVAQIGPTAFAERTALVAAYNAGIPAVVAERVALGKHVALVDMFTPFVSTPDYATALLVDEVHPNDAGHALIGQIWYEAIRAYLPAFH